MKMTSRVDDKNIRQTMLALKRNRPAALADSVVVMTAAALRTAYLVANTSIAGFGTNRYTRGWVHMHNDLAKAHGARLGFASLPLPPLTRSTLLKAAYEQLERRAVKIDAEIHQLRAERGRMRAVVRKKPMSTVRIDKEINRLQGLLLRSDNTLQEIENYAHRPGVLVMFGKATVKRFAASNIERVFPHEFGGMALLLRGNAKSVVMLKHNEPHVHIVERRVGAWRTASRDLRAETGKLVRQGSLAHVVSLKRGIGPGTHVTPGRRRSRGGA